MRLLVTGGAGFLGRHVTAAGLARGDAVTVLSRHPDRVTDLPRGARLLAGDLTDPTGLAATLSGLGEQAPQAVVHAAAVVADHDPKLYQVNVDGTAALCAALTALPQPPRLVHVSTFAVEDTPRTGYSDSKLAAEEVVSASGLPYVVLRPSLIYGRGDGTNTPALVEKMRQRVHWLPGGGRVLIQPVHVGDVAAACIAATERAGCLGRVYRLAGPEPVAVRRFREAVRDASGGAAAIRSMPLPLLTLAAELLALTGKPRARDVLAFHRRDHRVDISAACEDLGFQPRSLEAGLLETFGTPPPR